MKKKALIILEPLTSVLLAFLVGSLVILLIGKSPLTTFQTMLSGAFGTQANLGQTLMKTTTLTLCGLSYAFAYRCGLINIGAEGQMYMGALASTYVVLYLGWLPPFLVLFLALLIGFIGGGLFGLLVGWLKVRFGANEVITTVMLNYVASFVVEWAVTGPIQDPNSSAAQSIMFDQSLWLPYLAQAAKIHIGIVLAALALVFFGIFLWKTAPGFGMQVVGQNNKAAAYAGISVKKNVLMAMAFAGAFAGLAGGIEVLGVQHRLLKGMASNYGFDGIAVALLGGNHPVGMAFSGLLMGAMKNGGTSIQMFTGVPAAVVDLIRAFVIVFVLINVLRRALKNRKEALVNA